MTNETDQLPYNVKAEKAVLGGLLIDKPAIFRVKPMIPTPEMFYVVKHQWIYETICRLADTGTPADSITLIDDLEAHDKLTELGGAAYLTELINTTPTALNIEHHADIVRRRSFARKGIIAAGNIAATMYSANGEQPEELYSVAQSELDAIRPHTSSGTTTHHHETLDMEARQQRIRNQPPLVSWPWPGQRHYIRALYAGLTLVVGAETNVGKTIMMECIGEHAAREGDNTTLYYHLENTDDEMLHRRAIRLAGGMSMDDLREGYYGPEVRQASDMVRSWPGRIHYVGAWGWTASQIVADVKQKMREDGRIKVIILDYFQKLELDMMRGENKVDCRGRQFEQLTTCCVDNSLSFIIGSQMNKGSYAQQRKMAANLRGTGEIAEKGNIVVLLDRKIHDSTEPLRTPDGLHILCQPGGMLPETTIRFDKNKGPTGEMMMWCNGPRFLFTEAERREEPLDF